jgi:hypothetical protein
MQPGARQCHFYNCAGEPCGCRHLCVLEAHSAAAVLTTLGTAKVLLTHAVQLAQVCGLVVWQPGCLTCLHVWEV